MKHFLSLILPVLLVFSSFSLPVFANESDLTFTVGTVAAERGTTIEAPITITNNTAGLSLATVTVTFDSQRLEWAKSPEDYAAGTPATHPWIIGDMIGFTATPGAIGANTVTFRFGDINGITTPNGTLITLLLNVKKDALSGDAPISLSFTMLEDPNESAINDYNNIPGKVTVIDPLSFTHKSVFDVPSGYVGTAVAPIDVSSGAAGGTTPYEFSKVSGPGWISVSKEGIITGTPIETASATTAVISVADNALPIPAYKTITINVGAVTDNTAPAPGGGGAITTASIEQTKLTLNWTAATDNVSAPTSLKYYVYQSASGDIDMVDNCVANGMLLNSGCTVNITTFDVTGLGAFATYYFNVVVEDEAGNRAAYIMQETTTAAPPALAFTHSTAFDVPAGKVGTAITTIDVSSGASGGKLPHALSKVIGPEWLSVSSEEGIITGTRPLTEQPATTAVIKVTDSATPTAVSETITIQVGAVADYVPQTITAAIYSDSPYALGAQVVATPGTYMPNDGGVAGTHTYKWYRANDSNGTGATEISGAASSAYTPVTDDFGKYICVETTPVGNGSLVGTPVRSAYIRIGVRITANVTGGGGGTVAVNGTAGATGVVVYDASPITVAVSKNTENNLVAWTASGNAGSFADGMASSTTYTPPLAPTETIVLTAVLEASSTGVTLSQTTPYAFMAQTYGYDLITPLVVTVAQTGNQATGALTIALSGTDSGSFKLSKKSIANIEVGGNDSFTVEPETGLNAGSYSVTVTVSGANIASHSFNASFTVSKKDQETLTINTVATQKFAIPNPTVTLSTSGGSGTGAVSFIIVSGSGTISGSTLTITGAGNIEITATKQGDANYNGPVTSAVMNIEVNKANQTTPAITGGNINKVYGDASFTLMVTGGEGSGKYVFNSSDIDIAVIDENGLVTLGTGAAAIGTANLSAYRLGDTNYNDSAPASVTLTVDKAGQAVPELKYGVSGNFITVAPVAGAEYKFDLDGTQIWSDNNTFAFTEDMILTLYMRLAETATHYASMEIKLEIDASLATPDMPAAFTLHYDVDMPDTSYTVTIPPTSGAEYSFDGVNWDGTNIINGCLPGETVKGYKRMAAITGESNASGTVSDVVILPLFQVQTPTASPNGGSFTTSQNVTLSCGTPGANIYYWTGGTVPTAGRTLYNGPITLTETATLNAVATKEGMTDSKVVSVLFKKIETSSPSPGGGGGGGGVSSPASNFSGGSDYTRGSSVGLVLDIQKDFTQFSSVRVDNTSLTQNTDFTAGGSTIITLLPAYLDALSVGNHTITVNFRDGSNVSTRFTVSAAALNVTQQPEIAIEQDDTPLAEGPNPFVDVLSGAWYYNDVVYVYGSRLMNGTSQSPMLFSPDMALNRAMVVTVLYRMSGSPAVGLGNAFSDVLDGQWYTDAVNWASANGIVNGYGNGLFGPIDNVARQDLATLISRYAGVSGIDFVSGLDYAGFADDGDIQGYAADAVKWCVQNGIVNGKPGNIFDPAGEATRAEFAAILNRFLNQ